MKVRRIEGTNHAKLKNVAAYARVSTLADEQEESFETQYRYYHELINVTKGWRFVDVYADHGFSGSCAENRPAFMKMIEDARKGLIDIILVKSVSRFARNAIEANEYLHELKAINVEIRFDREHISSFDPSADMIFSVLAATAQEEIKSLSEKVKWTNRKLMERGIHHVGNNHLLGYDEKDGKLVPNKDAWIVKQIFEDCKKGMKSNSIADHINELGAKTMRAQGNYGWSQIERILDNEVYVGDRLLQKKPPMNYLTHKPDYTQAYDSHYVTDDHEGIISRELWDEVKAMRNKVKETRKAGIHYKEGCHPLYGKIFCTSCRLPYIRQTIKNGKKHEKTWICQDRKKGKKGNGCQNPIIKERHLLEAICEKQGTTKPDFDAVEKITIVDDYSIVVLLWDETKRSVN